jgi:hypothetical protein
VLYTRKEQDDAILGRLNEPMRGLVASLLALYETQGSRDQLEQTRIYELNRRIDRVIEDLQRSIEIAENTRNEVQFLFSEVTSFKTRALGDKVALDSMVRILFVTGITIAIVFAVFGVYFATR